jgi:hypothetical protein
MLGGGIFETLGLGSRCPGWAQDVRVGFKMSGLGSRCPGWVRGTGRNGKKSGLNIYTVIHKQREKKARWYRVLSSR